VLSASTLSLSSSTKTKKNTTLKIKTVSLTTQILFCGARALLEARERKHWAPDNRTEQRKKQAYM
jgi:hypothetical protein